MTCPQCRYALSAFDKSCPRCAQMQTISATTAVASHPVPVQSAAQEPHSCVACGCPTIQKVSGLYRGGVWSAESVGVGVGFGRTSGGQSFTTVSTSHATSAGGTSLAQALAPPIQPRRFQTKAENIVLGGTFFAFLVWLVGWMVVVDSFSPIPFPVFIIVASMITLVPIAAIPYALKAVREQKANLAVLLQRWQTVMSHWDQLYYCSRCDRVFNPKTGQHVPSHATNQALYQDILDGTSTL